MSTKLIASATLLKILETKLTHVWVEISCMPISFISFEQDT